MHYIVGDYPQTVTAWFSDQVVPNPRGAQFEDRAGSVRLTFPNGVRGYMDCSADQGHGMHVTYAGRNGRITVDELLGDMAVNIRLEEHRALPTTRYGMPANNEKRTITPADALAPSRAVLQALLDGENFPDGIVGYEAVRALVAAHVSAENGNIPVAIDDSLPADRVFPWA
jgi:predicted dehydrogenase